MIFAIAVSNGNFLRGHFLMLDFPASCMTSIVNHENKPDVRVVAHTLSYKAAYSLLASSSGVMLLSALYLMKSACGIDLMAGPSPLHAVFF